MTTSNDTRGVAPVCAQSEQWTPNAYYRALQIVVDRMLAIDLRDPILEHVDATAV